MLHFIIHQPTTKYTERRCDKSMWAVQKDSALLIRRSSHLHAKENIVLWTDTQTLSDGTQLSPDVSAKNEGSARGWREKPGQNGPANRGHHYEDTDTKLDTVQMNRRFKSTSRSGGTGNIQ